MWPNYRLQRILCPAAAIAIAVGELVSREASPAAVEGEATLAPNPQFQPL